MLRVVLELGTERAQMLNEIFSAIFVIVVIVSAFKFVSEETLVKKEKHPMKETNDLKDKIIALMKDSHVSADDGIENFADKLIELFDKEKKNMANNIANK